jgi:hypothetical protein
MGGWREGFSPGSARGGRRLLTEVKVLHRPRLGAKMLFTVSAQKYFFEGES